MKTIEQHHEGSSIEPYVNEQGFALVIQTEPRKPGSAPTKHTIYFSNGYLTSLMRAASTVVDFHQQHARELAGILAGKA